MWINECTKTRNNQPIIVPVRKFPHRRFAVLSQLHAAICWPNEHTPTAANQFIIYINWVKNCNENEWNKCYKSQQCARQNVTCKTILTLERKCGGESLYKFHFFADVLRTGERCSIALKEDTWNRNCSTDQKATDAAGKGECCVNVWRGCGGKKMFVVPLNLLNFTHLTQATSYYFECSQSLRARSAKDGCLRICSQYIS